MQVGIVIQTIAITSVTLLAYYLGRYTDPQHIEFAETMAFVTLSCSELLRAYTARSEYYPLLKIGLFGNKFMNYAVLSSLFLIMLVVYVPFLQTIFNTRPLGLAAMVRNPSFTYHSIAGSGVHQAFLCQAPGKR